MLLWEGGMKERVVVVLRFINFIINDRNLVFSLPIYIISFCCPYCFKLMYTKRVKFIRCNIIQNIDATNLNFLENYYSFGFIWSYFSTELIQTLGEMSRSLHNKELASIQQMPLSTANIHKRSPCTENFFVVMCIVVLSGEKVCCRNCYHDIYTLYILSSAIIGHQLWACIPPPTAVEEKQQGNRCNIKLRQVYVERVGV